MEIKNIGSRGILFTFYDLGIPTNVYVIVGEKYFYIIDTYLGVEIMKNIVDYITVQYGKKEFIIINTHSHWDHVWGNSMFSSSLIIAHVLCKKHMEEEGVEELEENKSYKKGEVILTPPNMTFTDKIFFNGDNILIYYTPGHTDDCVSIVDLQDKVLYAGDNLERPIPYITLRNFDKYIRTLKDYLNLDVEKVIGGHTSCESKKLIEDNLYYVRKVSIGETEEFESGEYEDYHKENMKSLL